MVMEIIRDTEDKEVDRRPWQPHDYWIEDPSQVQGYPLESYLPKNKAKHNFIRWTFDCVENRESAVAEQRRATKKNASLYPDDKSSFAAASWDWPEMPISIQKLINPRQFNAETYFSRGAHMPVMLFIGEKNKTRRSPEAEARRARLSTIRRSRREDPKLGGEHPKQDQWTDGKWARSSS